MDNKIREIEADQFMTSPLDSPSAVLSPHVKELPFEERDFFKAVKNGDLMKVYRKLKRNRNLVNLSDDLKESPLHWAAKRGHVLLVELLLCFEASLEERDLFQRTALQMAERNMRERCK